MTIATTDIDNDTARCVYRKQNYVMEMQDESKRNCYSYKLTFYVSNVLIACRQCWLINTHWYTLYIVTRSFM